MLCRRSARFRLQCYGLALARQVLLMPATPQFHATPRTLTHDKKGILVDGFELRKYREYETFTVWKCLRNRRTCRCIIKTANSTLEILSTNKAHNHDAPADTAVTYDVSESSQWEIFVTRREKRSLRIDNFVYYRIKEDDDTVYWKCSNNKCNARAQSDYCLSNKKIINGSHNHPPRSEDFFHISKNKPWCENTYLS